MATMNVSLTDELMAFVEAQAALRGHASAVEYVQALIREAQKRTAKQELEANLREGMESGPTTEMIPADWDELERQVWERRRVGDADSPSAVNPACRDQTSSRRPA